MDAYVGTPGSFKSYSAVANVILPALQRGRRVVSNIPLNEDKLISHGFHQRFIYISNDQIIDELINVVHLNHGAVFVLDEMWRVWPSGLRQNQLPEGHAQWLAEHRHYSGPDGYTDDITLIAQSLTQIAASVRALVDQTMIHTKLRAAGSQSKYRVDVYSGPQTGSGQPSKRLTKLYGQGRQAIYDWYKSHTHSDGAPPIELKEDKRGVVWRSPGFLFATVGGTVAIIAGLSSVMSFFSPNIDASESAPFERSENGADSDASVMTHEPGFTTDSSSDTSADPQLPQSDRWRITGMVDAGPKLLVLVTDGAVTRRVVGPQILERKPLEIAYNGEAVSASTGGTQQTLSSEIDSIASSIVPWGQ